MRASDVDEYFSYDLNKYITKATGAGERMAQ